VRDSAGQGSDGLDLLRLQELRLELLGGFLRAHALGHVPRHPGNAGHETVHVAPRRVDRFEHQVADGHDVVDRFAGQAPAHVVDDARCLAVDVVYRLAHDLSGLQAQHLESATLGKREDAVAVNGEQDDRRLLDQRAQSLLGVP
jgi:hypothetical protein